MHPMHARTMIRGLVVFSFALAVMAHAESARERQIAVASHLSTPVTIQGAPAPGLLLAGEMKARKVPGVSIAVIRSGKLDWASGYGVTALGGPPVSTETMFAAASISKPVTALGVLRLVQDGTIGLDAEANRYLKRWKIPGNAFTAEHKVTVRELLNHTSGIGTHFGAVYDPHQPLPTLLQVLNGEKPATTDPVRVEAVPGTTFAYANGGYLILQLLIEDVTGESFASYMDRAVLSPLGMTHSTFEAPLPARDLSSAATAYQEDGATPIPPSQFYEPNLAAGGLWTTPTDLVRFLIELQREYTGASHRVLDQRMARLMLTRGLGNWGLGIEVGGSPQNFYFTHEGSAYFQNLMAMYASGDGAVIMTSGGGGGTLANELMLSVSQVYGWPDFKPIEHPVVPLTLQQESRFVGTFAYIKVAIVDGYLTAEIPAGSPPARLYPETPTHFFHLNLATELFFVQDDSGKVTGLEFVTQRGQHLLNKDP